MRKRRAYNPKRRISSLEDLDLKLNEAQGKKLRYTGNPEHKRNPGDFGLDPPSSPRLGKTLCDDVRIHSRAEALKLLRAGFSKGLVSVWRRAGWPQNVWAVTEDGKAVEAQLEGDGVYHGYPMAHADPPREEVLTQRTQR